jgi:hypothetical protein
MATAEQPDVDEILTVMRASVREASESPEGSQGRHCSSSYSPSTGRGS